MYVSLPRIELVRPIEVAIDPIRIYSYFNLLLTGVQRQDGGVCTSWEREAREALEGSARCTAYG